MSTSILQTLQTLTQQSAILALNKRAAKTAELRARSDSIVALTPDHLFSSISSPMATAVVTPESSTSSNSTATSSSQSQRLDQNEVKTLLYQSYEFQEMIGKGASAVVHQVQHKATGEKFACKLVFDDKKMNDETSMRLEARIMKKLDHPNVTKMHELYETKNAMWMVMELAHGPLLKGLSDLPVYSEANIATIFRQLLLGVQYLHSKGIVHRDLKMDNLLQSSDISGKEPFIVKIADFGLSAITIKLEGDVERNSKHISSLSEVWGTEEYMAPEVYQRAYGFQADVYSLGCILFEMLTGELAFPHREEEMSLMSRIIALQVSKPKKLFETSARWSTLSPLAQSLIKGMLKTRPTSRLNIEECLNHPWFEACADSSNLSLNLHRLSIREAITQRYNTKLRKLAAQIKNEKKSPR